MGICRNCGSQDLYQVGNMFFHSFNKFAFTWNRRPICLAYSADNQLFCFGHIDEAPMALMSGLDLRPRHYLVWPAGLSLEFSHAAPFQQSRGVAQFITQPHRETMNLIHTHTQNYAHCRFADYPTVHVFECGRKPGYLERICRDTGITCKFHRDTEWIWINIEKVFVYCSRCGVLVESLPF